jgi:predicted enzyme related to lactoylglutathione lyase
MSPGTSCGHGPSDRDHRGSQACVESQEPVAQASLRRGARPDTGGGVKTLQGERPPGTVMPWPFRRPPGDAGGYVPCLGGVHHLDSVRSRMEEAGVAFEGPTEVVEGFVKLATFLDPDGNRVMLAEDLQGGSER